MCSTARASAPTPSPAWRSSSLPTAPDLLDVDGVSIRVRRSPRARRLTLRVADDEVVLTAPPRVARAALQAFVADRSAWLAGALARRPTPVRPVLGGTIPVGGRDVPIVPGPRLRLDDRLEVPPRRRLGPAVRAALAEAARTALTARCDAHAAALGVAVSQIAIRDPRSRWGSCSSAGRLMFSLRLAMAPPEILDYVAAHEVAHRRQMNHSPAFWAEVARLVPDHASQRAWLRRHGADLHRWRFD